MTDNHGIGRYFFDGIQGKLGGAHVRGLLKKGLFYKVNADVVLFSSART
jgi:hypothetical protein